MSLIFITFIFRLSYIPDKTFYGKYYTDYISPDHEGLDEEIRPYLLKAISEYQKQKKLPEVKEKVHIGIMSVSNYKYISIHSTNEERNCFDFYCEKFTINHKICMEMYMFGKLIENPEV
jgi:hypothetical protein